jgi:threonine dehydratase
MAKVAVTGDDTLVAGGPSTTGPDVAELEGAATAVYRHLPPTPQIRWPLLDHRAGCEVWVKHENHTPIGAFKVRGGLVYMDALRREWPDVTGVISATRGNHGQSIAFAAGRIGLKATIVVPRGNNPEKNAAMAALGAELVEYGADFQEAYEYTEGLAAERGLPMIRAFHPWLVRGVATYGLELFRAVADLDTVYVPIGRGSGICGLIAARDALGLATRVVGVVSADAAAYALSFEAGRSPPTQLTPLPTASPAGCPTRRRSRSFFAAPSRWSPSETMRSSRPWPTTSPTPTTLPRAPALRRWQRCSRRRTAWLENTSASSSPAVTPTRSCSEGCWPVFGVTMRSRWRWKIR